MEMITLTLGVVFFVCLVLLLYSRVLYAQKQAFTSVLCSFFMLSLCVLTAELYPHMEVVYELYFANRLGEDGALILLKNISYQLGIILFVQAIAVVISFLLVKMITLDERYKNLQKSLISGVILLGIVYVIKEPLFDFAASLIKTGVTSGFN